VVKFIAGAGFGEGFGAVVGRGDGAGLGKQGRFHAEPRGPRREKGGDKAGRVA